MPFFQELNILGFQCPPVTSVTNFTRMPHVEDAVMIMKREVEIYVAVHGCLNVAFQGVHWNAFGRNSLDADGGRCAFECERLNFVTNSLWQLGPWSEVGVTKAPPFPYCIRIFCFLSNIFE